MVKNLPSNAGDVGSIPGWGTKIPQEEGQLSPHALEPMPQLERSLHDAMKDPTCHNKDPACGN